MQPTLRRIVMLAVPPVEELDIVGPWEVFATANNALGQSGPAYSLALVTTGRKLSFVGDSGLTLLATRYYKTTKRDIDTLIVPGGSGAQARQGREVLWWIRKISRNARRVVSICTGAFLLARAGLLDGKKVTTHWKFADELARQYHKLRAEGDRI